MAYKDILVHLDNSARAAVRLRVAIELAAQHGAHLAGIYAHEIPSPAVFMGDNSIFDMRVADEIFRVAREQASETRNAVGERFREALRKNGVDGEWREVDAPAAETVAVHGRYADLIIVGQDDPEHLTSPADSGIPETAILDSGRPVLVIPCFGEIKPIGRTVLVGWKSGREAARAVNDALPLLAHARSVTVLAIDPKKGIGGDGDVPAADIALHLARHGITAIASHTISGGVSEGDILLNHVSDMGGDLIVAGGYGRSRAREFIMGGATRTLLATMTVPVLFSH